MGAGEAMAFTKQCWLFHNKILSSENRGGPSFVSIVNTSNLQFCSNAFIVLYRFRVTTSREIVQLIFATTPSSPFLIWDKDLTGAAANMGIFSLLHGDQRTLIPTGEKLLRNPLSHPINTKRWSSQWWNSLTSFPTVTCVVIAFSIICWMKALASFFILDKIMETAHPHFK